MTACKTCLKLLHDFDAAVSTAIDNAKLSGGGDLAEFGSTNDLDWLRDVRQAMFNHAAVDECPTAQPGWTPDD